MIKRIFHITIGIIACLAWLTAISSLFRPATGTTVEQNNLISLWCVSMAIFYTIVFLLTAPKTSKTN